MSDMIEKIKRMTMGGSPFLLLQKGIVLPVHEVKHAFEKGEVSDEASIMDFVAQWWKKNYGPAFAPVEWLEQADKDTLLRAEPFLRLVFEGRTVNKDLLEHFEKLKAEIEDAQLESGDDWDATFNFVKHKIGSMNQLLPISDISTIALEEMPVLPLALADNIEERSDSSDNRDYFDILENKQVELKEQFHKKYNQ